ncbi:MAG: RsmB/NOP family class I SAM-dependent RNA methyltransferase, partial [Vampirovibrio sp.]|nr:RsmB/NOP family class I SAM-dependent RNA methyltransferase [Vampirovibrio sp.]
YHQPDPTLPACLHLDEFAGSPRKLPGYEEGWFAVQDLSSAVVSTWMNPQPGETIVDLCAAPGSKTAHLADLMQDTGSIIAVEPEKERIARLTENLMRLGIQCVMVVQGKGETVEVDPAWNAIDEILVDAPCSGLGTVRKHPEILLQLKEADVTGYAKLQLALLRHAVTLIKPGGKLIYSTCSLHPAENQEVVQAFLRDCPSATLVREEQRLITQVQDGFYIAQFEC